MDQKKIDPKSILAIVLISGILMWIGYQNQPTQEEIEAAKKKKEIQHVENKEDNKQTNLTTLDLTQNDSLRKVQLQNALGSFAQSGLLSEQTIVLENELLKLEISNKGGYITKAEVKNFEQFEKNSNQIVSIIKDNNASFNIQLKTQENRLLDTKDMLFEPSITEQNGNKILTLKLKSDDNKYLEYRYVLKPNEYMLDFSIKTQGLESVLDTSKPLVLTWELETYRNEKSVTYENRYTELIYEYDGGKDDYLNQSSFASTTEKDVTYIAYKQHFFTSILLTDTPFKEVKMSSKNLVKNEEVDTLKTKVFSAEIPLEFKAGEINYAMNWYYGPSDYKILNKYDRNLDEIIPLGWGIFGWINKYLFIPVFGFIIKFVSSYGLAIILFTILVRIAISPITYKSYLSQAKQKALRPDIQEINEKYKKDPMKKQQELMSLYSKAGVNPMAGCIPALLQIPIFYALFQFFPSAIELRQKGFLWADDLSSFDSIAKLPFYIPFYGNHISLFPILAGIAIFFYMKMTTGDQQLSQPPQEGMPDMAKIMKIMIYISPIMMIIFFNMYASGLSLYYFISNLITIGIMLVIKYYIIDNEKIHAKIQENKLKPKTESKFQKRLREAMEQAQEQQRLKQNKK
ncbi:MAG: membrane protein insertase YidC [Bacteroidota bacterium]|nr:membrane protein insertase YidC [Bacteroidota bacterium]